MQRDLQIKKNSNKTALTSFMNFMSPMDHIYDLNEVHSFQENLVEIIKPFYRHGLIQKDFINFRISS